MGRVVHGGWLAVMRCSDAYFHHSLCGQLLCASHLRPRFSSKRSLLYRSLTPSLLPAVHVLQHELGIGPLGHRAALLEAIRTVVMQADDQLSPGLLPAQGG